MPTEIDNLTKERKGNRRDKWLRNTTRP